MRVRIEELAQQVGLTVRNIRAYQGRGLIPPPELEGRTGYYGEEHLRRVELVKDLQERGFSLAAIRQTLDLLSRGGNLGTLVGFRQVFSAPFEAEEPGTYRLDDLLAAFPEARDDPALITRAIELGMIEPIEGDEVGARSPTLIEAGKELVRLGVPLAEVLDLVELLHQDAKGVADRFVRIVAEHVIEPFLAAEDRELPEETVDTILRLRPIAIEIIRPFMADAMARSIEEALDRYGLELERAAQPPRGA